MRIWVVIVLCLASLGLSLWNTCETSMAEVIDKIAAIVDKDIILLSEIREYAAMPIVYLIANLAASEDVEQVALHYIVERRLLLREVQYLAVPREDDMLKSLAMQYIATQYHHSVSKSADNFENCNIESTNR